MFTINKHRCKRKADSKLEKYDLHLEITKIAQEEFLFRIVKKKIILLYRKKHFLRIKKYKVIYYLNYLN